jgi:tetratricopeptide (TPR) repeat protein
MTTRTPHVLLTGAILMAAAGCATAPAERHWVSFKPVHPPVQAEFAGAEGDYAAAVSAISRRDYALALDMLQAANARKAGDVRVLNAFGVVYDKLGRFDLSARYYASARTADAGSAIIANNVAYSAILQDQAVLAPARSLAATARPLTLAAAPPAIIRLAAATPIALPLITAPRRRGLEIADGSGRAGGAAPIVIELARLGWSTPKAAIHQAPRTIRTTITYAAYRAPVARSLARTLPPGVRLVDCQATCGGVRLTLGTDSLAWPARVRSALQSHG